MSQLRLLWVILSTCIHYRGHTNWRWCQFCGARQRTLRQGSWHDERKLKEAHPRQHDYDKWEDAQNLGWIYSWRKNNATFRKSETKACSWTDWRFILYRRSWEGCQILCPSHKFVARWQQNQECWRRSFGCLETLSWTWGDWSEARLDIRRVQGQVRWAYWRQSSKYEGSASFQLWRRSEITQIPQQQRKREES